MDFVTNCGFANEALNRYLIYIDSLYGVGRIWALQKLENQHLMASPCLKY